MMPGVCAVEQTPFLGVQRSKKRMIQQQSVLSKTTLRILQGGVHGYEGVVEAPNGSDIKAILGINLLKGGSPGRHPTEFRHRYFSRAMLPCGNTSERPASLQNSSQALGSASVGKQQVLEDLRS